MKYKFGEVVEMEHEFYGKVSAKVVDYSKSEYDDYVYIIYILEIISGKATGKILFLKEKFYNKETELSKTIEELKFPSEEKNEDHVIIKKNVGIEQGSTTFINQFVEAVNTWKELECLKCVQVTPSRMKKILEDLNKKKEKIESILIIKEKKK